MRTIEWQRRNSNGTMRAVPGSDSPPRGREQEYTVVCSLCGYTAIARHLDEGPTRRAEESFTLRPASLRGDVHQCPECLGNDDLAPKKMERRKALLECEAGRLFYGQEDEKEGFVDRMDVYEARAVRTAEYPTHCGGEDAGCSGMGTMYFFRDGSWIECDCQGFDTPFLPNETPHSS
jgi:hypothetical protein